MGNFGSFSLKTLPLFIIFSVVSPDSNQDRQNGWLLWCFSWRKNCHCNWIFTVLTTIKTQLYLLTLTNGGLVVSVPVLLSSSLSGVPTLLSTMSLRAAKSAQMKLSNKFRKLAQRPFYAKLVWWIFKTVPALSRRPCRLVRTGRLISLFISKLSSQGRSFASN